MLLLVLILHYVSWFGALEFQNVNLINKSYSIELESLFEELKLAPNALIAQAIEEDVYIAINTSKNQSINGLMAIAKTHESNSEFQNALNIYRQIIETEPEYSGAYTSLAAILFQNGEFDEASKILKIATRIEPRNYNAWSALGIVLAQQNELKDARKAFEQALIHNPYDDTAKRGIFNIESKLDGLAM